MYDVILDRIGKRSISGLNWRRVGMCARARTYIPDEVAVVNDQRRRPQRTTTTGTRWTRVCARLAREASSASFLAASDCGSYVGRWSTSIVPAVPLGPAAAAADDR